MNRRPVRRWTVALAAAMPMLVSTCAKTETKIGDETHFACNSDGDCKRLGSGFSCRGGVCRAAGDAGSDSSVQADGRPPRQSGSALPPFTEVDGRSPFTGTGQECTTEAPGPTQGACPLPQSPCVPGSTEACWDVPEAPGPEECKPSAAADYGTRCCTAGRCSFDYGNGCGSPFLVLPGQTASTSGVPGIERVYDAEGATPLTQFTMNDARVYAAQGAPPGVLLNVSKTSNERRQLHVTDVLPHIGYMTATSQLVFFTAGAKLYTVPAGGGAAPKEVSLSHLFGSTPLELGPLGSRGDSAYVSVVPQVGDGGTPEGSLVHVPCCNGTPEILGRRPGEELSGGMLVQDGNRIFMLGESFVPMVDFQIHLSYFDLSSGQGKTIFRGIPSSTTIQPLGVHRGLPYFAQYGQLTTIDVDTCAARAAVQNRIFDGVSAFAADDHAIYWAETYTDLSVSRVFMKKDDSSAVLQVVEASGEVTWLGADATHLYWAEAQGDAPRRYYIFRVALPK